MTRLALAALLALWAPVGGAWDTLVEEGDAWKSIYQRGKAKSIAEHTVISDMTFRYLDRSGRLQALFGRRGEARIKLRDLNASLFRADTVGLGPKAGDDPATLIEERDLPPPGHFAGLPDYSYAIYDWLNKNGTCPAFPGETYTSRCHDFLGWLGALNSVHFGSQATRMYAYLHLNALALARRAATTRGRMTAAERDAYQEELREADLLALSYEGYAQHFLQDRWAIGHMWERWGSPDTVQEDRFLPEHLVVGAVAGMIHGAEALVRDHPSLKVLLEPADPMSSPVPGDGSRAAQPMTYRTDTPFGLQALVPAIGDERLSDARIGFFSLNDYYPSRENQILSVTTQMDQMLRCAGAGWAEVIRALGPGDKEGFGAFNAPLNADAPDFAVIEDAFCWNNWATNRSMMIGLLGPNPNLSLELISRLEVETLVEQSATPGTAEQFLPERRSALVRLAQRLHLYGRMKPDGIELATGADAANIEREALPLTRNNANSNSRAPREEVGAFLGFKHGGNYAPPNYLVPIRLTPGSGSDASNVNLLPKHDPRGRDIETLYGAFNGAMADHWCADRSVLVEVRDEPTPRNLEICSLLAGRAAQGTHPTYTGTQQIQRTFGEQPIRSLCLALTGSNDGDAVERRDQDDPGNPFWLDQGYVPAPGDGAGQATLDDAVENWCKRTPVLDLSRNADLARDNLVGEFDPDGTSLLLTGTDLGTQPGEILLQSATGTFHAPEVVSWDDDSIALSMEQVNLEPEQNYTVTLTAYDEDGTPRQSVGLFRLRVGRGFDPSGVYRSFDGGRYRIEPVDDQRREYRLIIDVPSPSLAARGYGSESQLMSLVSNKQALGGRVTHRYRRALVERCAMQPEEFPVAVYMEKFETPAAKRPTQIFVSWRIRDPLPNECATAPNLTVGLTLYYDGPLASEDAEAGTAPIVEG